MSSHTKRNRPLGHLFDYLALITRRVTQEVGGIQNVHYLEDLF